jgi:hypothetical protein
MSPIAVGLDLLLITLLLTALVVGLRLSKRLKALRDGQEGFVKAVSELDTAAARAENALVALRAASEDAHDTLLTRIETARGLIVKLDKAADVATRAAAAIQAAPPAAPAPAALSRAETRLDPRFRAAAPAPAPAPAPIRPANARPAVARNLDDDLFEAPAPMAWRAGDRR